MRDAFIEGERKAWRAFDFEISTKRRDYAGALFQGVRVYEEEQFRKAGSAGRLLVGASGKGRGLYFSVEAGKRAYEQAVSRTQAEYMAARSGAAMKYRAVVDPLRGEWERAILRSPQGHAPAPVSSLQTWLPRASGAPASQRPAGSPVWLPIIVALLALSSLAMLTNPFGDAIVRMVSLVFAAMALFGFFAWREDAIAWKLGVLLLFFAGAFYVTQTGEWEPALGPWAMAALAVALFSGAARKTFLKKPAAEGSPP